MRMFNPQSLLVAYGLAKMQEEHVLTARRFRSSNFFIFFRGGGGGGGSSTQQTICRELEAYHAYSKNFSITDGGKDKEVVML
jgi:hypothetical protein